MASLASGRKLQKMVEVVRGYRVDRDAGVDAALGRVPGQQLGFLQDGVAGGGLDEQRRQPGQGRLQRAEQRIVGRVAGQVGLGQAVRHIRREDQRGILRRPLRPPGQVDPRAQQRGPGRPREVALAQRQQQGHDQAAR